MKEKYKTRSWNSMIEDVTAKVIHRDFDAVKQRYLYIDFIGKKIFQWELNEELSEMDLFHLKIDLKIVINKYQEIFFGDPIHSFKKELEKAILSACKHKYGCEDLINRYQIIKHCRKAVLFSPFPVPDVPEMQELPILNEPETTVTTGNISAILEALKGSGNYECTLTIKWQGGSSV